MDLAGLEWGQRWRDWGQRPLPGAAVDIPPGPSPAAGAQQREGRAKLDGHFSRAAPGSWRRGELSLGSLLRWVLVSSHAWEQEAELPAWKPSPAWKPDFTPSPLTCQRSGGGKLPFCPAGFCHWPVCFPGLAHTETLQGQRAGWAASVIVPAPPRVLCDVHGYWIDSFFKSIQFLLAFGKKNY